MAVRTRGISYVLMARVSKNNDWERCEDLEWTFDMDDINVATSGCGVASGKMIDDQNDQIPNGNKRNDRGVFQAVQPAKK